MSNNALQIGDKAPNFNVPADGGKTVSLDQFKGKNVVLYFYPKDDTPGCSQQAQDFRDKIDEFNNANAVVIGVSKDSVAKHDKFKQKYTLPFPLASDEQSDTAENYGVWVEKNMYGKKYMGIERATYLIDSEGNIQKIWRKVKVKGHIDEVLASIGAANS